MNCTYYPWATWFASLVARLSSSFSVTKMLRTTGSPWGIGLDTCIVHIPVMHRQVGGVLCDMSTFNLPVLVLKAIARHLSLCLIGVGVPDNALGWFPLGFVEDKHFMYIIFVGEAHFRSCDLSFPSSSLFYQQWSVPCTLGNSLWHL